MQFADRRDEKRVTQNRRAERTAKTRAIVFANQATA